ncbi:MAG: redoxin domain-containing protein [Armatimonadetes bacterium]|nr:redoxin domain-containing protein [Armatimonadota bacterium]
MLTTLVLAAQARPLVPAGPPVPFPVLRAESWMGAADPFNVRNAKGKVVLVHFTPTFCCGYDHAAKLVRQALDRYGRKGLTAFGVFSGTLDGEQTRIWTDVQRHVPVNWPVMVDKDGATTKALFPTEGEVQYSFSFIDRKGSYRKFRFEKLDDVFPAIEKLLAERA